MENYIIILENKCIYLYDGNVMYQANIDRYDGQFYLLITPRMASYQSYMLPIEWPSSWIKYFFKWTTMAKKAFSAAPL